MAFVENIKDSIKAGDVSLALAVLEQVSSSMAAVVQQADPAA